MYPLGVRGIEETVGRVRVREYSTVLILDTALTLIKIKMNGNHIEFINMFSRTVTQKPEFCEIQLHSASLF